MGDFIVLAHIWSFRTNNSRAKVRVLAINERNNEISFNLFSRDSYSSLQIMFPCSSPKHAMASSGLAVDSTLSTIITEDSDLLLILVEPGVNIVVPIPYQVKIFINFIKPDYEAYQSETELLFGQQPC